MIKDTKENFLEVWLNINDSSQLLEVHARREIKLPHSRLAEFANSLSKALATRLSLPQTHVSSRLKSLNSCLVSPHFASQSNIFFFQHLFWEHHGLNFSSEIFFVFGSLRKYPVPLSPGILSTYLVSRLPSHGSPLTCVHSNFSHTTVHLQQLSTSVFCIRSLVIFLRMIFLRSP